MTENTVSLEDPQSQDRVLVLGDRRRSGADRYPHEGLDIHGALADADQVFQ